MSLQQQQEIDTLKDEVADLREKVAEMYRAFDAFKKDVKEADYEPLKRIPPMPRCLIEFGYVQPDDEKEFEELTSEMKPESDDE